MRYKALLVVRFPEKWGAMGVPRGYKGIYTFKIVMHCTSNGHFSY